MKIGIVWNDNTFWITQWGGFRNGVCRGLLMGANSIFGIIL